MNDQMELIPPQKSPKRKTTDKATVILEGAMQEFMTCGYAAASMHRIAIAAGVSKPTLYSYFQDKEALFTALIQQMVLGTSISKLLEDGGFLQLPLRESLKQLATILLDKFSSSQPLSTLFRLLIGESGRFPNLAQTFVHNIEKPILAELSRLFANHPDLKATDPEVIARFFQGSIIHYILIQEILHGREIVPLERDRFVNGLIDVIIGERSHLTDDVATTPQSKRI
ncbi:transcriptional regulator [Kalymmatonema gypsitolerans NIES-4073]|nr:transcriptional regulator [Scytonema sp. NIES-4073]